MRREKKNWAKVAQSVLRAQPSRSKNGSSTHEKWLWVAGAAVATLGLAARSSAATLFVANSGSFNDATIYTPNKVPTGPSPIGGTNAGDIVQFNNTTTAFTVTVDATSTIDNVQVGVSPATPGLGTLTVTNGGSLTTGYSFTNTNQTAITNGGLASQLLFGRAAGSVGNFNLYTGGIVTLTTVNNASGTAATIFNGNLGGLFSLADRSGATGTANVFGGTLNIGKDLLMSAGNQNGGTSSVSTFNQSGGAVSVTNGAIIMSGLSTYTLSGGTLVQGGTRTGRAAGTAYEFSGTSASGINVQDGLVVGVNPTAGAPATASQGTFNQSGGTVTLSGGLSVGGNTLGNGTYNFSGGTLDASASRYGFQIGSNLNAFGDTGVKSGFGAFKVSSSATSGASILTTKMDAAGTSGASFTFFEGSDAGTTPITLSGSASNTLQLSALTQFHVDSLPLSGYGNTNAAFVLMSATNLTAGNLPSQLQGGSTIPVISDDGVFAGYVVEAVANPDPAGSGFLIEAVNGSSVPEPASLGLMGLAAMGVVRRRRRRI